ncbi:MAG: HlyD family efflux transporter periplasmic adaptor subunit [Chloroflexaceae bacterium]|nr:HlyD family efflux transporter periplasmic adaptor subunit [Chloroflexaceae bacterium]
MRLPLVTLLLVALVVSACSSTSTTNNTATPTPRPPAPALEKQTYTVAKGEIVDEIKVSGTVAAMKQEDLSFAQSGFVKVVNIQRNDVITKGMVLAELDLGDLPNQLRQAEVNYEQVKIQYDRSATTRDLARQRAQLDLEEAKANLSRLTDPKPADIARARATLENAKANLASVIASANNAVDDQQAALNSAQRSLPLVQEAFSQALYDWEGVKNAMNTAYQNLQAAKANRQPLIDAAQANLDTAQIAYTQLTATPDRDDVAAAQRAVTRAELAVKEASQTGDPELEKQLSAAQLQLENITAAIAAGQLIAPFDGKVAEVATGPGKQVDAYRSVITVMDDAEKELLVQNVSTDDASRIGVGMVVDIFFARAPAVAVPGTIVKLPTKATSSAATINPDPAYHIEFAPPSALELTVGDLASVVITLKRQKDALWLPPQAVRTFEGRRFVVVKEGTKQRRQDVRIGIVNSEKVEILEGLNEGDVVVGQ